MFYRLIECSRDEALGSIGMSRSGIAMTQGIACDVICVNLRDLRAISAMNVSAVICAICGFSVRWNLCLSV